MCLYSDAGHFHGETNDQTTDISVSGATLTQAFVQIRHLNQVQSNPDVCGSCTYTI